MPAGVSVVDLFGWACALFGSLLSLPQVVHLLRSRTSAGLSLTSWQLMLAANIGWTTHGIIADRVNIIVPNAVLLVCTVLVLRMIRLDRRQSWFAVTWLGLMVGVACIAVDLVLGPVAFGLFVMGPLGLGALAQLRDLLRAPDLSGVSPGYLVVGFAGQFMWGAWALLAHERAVITAASIMAVFAGLNLGAWALRRAGVLRPRDPIAPSPDAAALAAEQLAA